MNIEEISAKVHQAYCEDYKKRNDKPYWTNGDYSKLDDSTKEIDRKTVRAVASALGFKEENGYFVQQQQGQH